MYILFHHVCHYVLCYMAMSLSLFGILNSKTVMKFALNQTSVVSNLFKPEYKLLRS